MTKLAENHGKNPFDILCRQCPLDCDFNLPTSGIPVEDYLKEWDLHYEAALEPCAFLTCKLGPWQTWSLEALDPVAAEKARQLDDSCVLPWF